MPHKFDTIVNASVSVSESEREKAKRLIIISSKTLVVVSKHNRESLSDSGVERENLIYPLALAQKSVQGEWTPRPPNYAQKK